MIKIKMLIKILGTFDYTKMSNFLLEGMFEHEAILMMICDIEQKITQGKEMAIFLQTVNQIRG